MSDDWLQHGHETEGVELVPVLSTSSVLDDRAGAPSRPRWTSGWRGVMAGGTIALFATLGVVGVANAISDNLFPSMGPTSPASVWQNPVPAQEPATTSVTTVPSTTSVTTVPSTTAPAPASTIPATAPSPTTSAPRNAVDREDGDVVVTTTDAADDEPDDRIDDNSGSSSGSGSGRDDSDDSDDSDSSGSSGSGKSGSDDSRDSDDD